MSIARVLIIVCILFATSLGLGYFEPSGQVQPKRPLGEFPTTIGAWQGTVDRFENRIYDVLGVDDSILSHFKDDSGNYVQLYIGYYGSQREGDLIHSPKNCMPGGGWNIVDTSIVTLSVPSARSQPVSVIRLDLENGLRRQVVLYWYHSRGRVIHSEYKQKVYLIIDSITRQRTDGSFIRLISPVVHDENQTLDVLKNFAVQLFPLLDDYIPS